MKKYSEREIEIAKKAAIKNFIRNISKKTGRYIIKYSVGFTIYYTKFEKLNDTIYIADGDMIVVKPYSYSYISLEGESVGKCIDRNLMLHRMNNCTILTSKAIRDMVAVGANVDYGISSVFSFEDEKNVVHHLTPLRTHVAFGKWEQVLTLLDLGADPNLLCDNKRNSKQYIDEKINSFDMCDESALVKMKMDLLLS